MPINGLTYRINGQHNLDENSNTVKHEKLPSVFSVNRQQQSPLQKDDEEEDYEAELKFTPRLKSRGSLLTMRKNSAQDSPSSSDEASTVENLTQYETPQWRQRNHSHAASLRKTLGDPLPLPYLSNEGQNLQNHEDVSPPGTATVDRKRRLMESKWRKLVSQDKLAVENRFKEVRKPSLPTESIGRPASPTLVSEPAINVPRKSLEELQQEIVTNRQKLDEIIVLLNQKQKIALPFNLFHYDLNESTLWTICIIMLILCNIYVYYYL